jgi:flagellin
MSLRINSNSNSTFSNYQLQKSQKDLSGSIERLSTGRRINKAADDASGMAIANKLESLSKAFGQDIRNANDAISIVQVADGAMEQATDLLQNIRVKAMQAGNASQSTESRLAIQADIDKSLEALGNIANDTSFNGQKLLSGTFTNKQFQIGANSGETINISLGSIEPSKISDGASGTLSDIDVTTDQGVRQALEVTDMAIAYIDRQRSQAGSTQNQLESTINNLSTTMINTMAAESEIRDLDFAEESSNLNRIKLLAKARAFAQAQASNVSKNILNVLG